MQLTGWLMEMVLALAGLGLSGWLLWWTRGKLTLPGCGAGSGCEAVLSSRWARLGPVSIVWLGFLLYLLASVVAGFLLFFGGVSPQYLLVSLLFLAMVAGLAGIWFVFLQVAVLKRICRYCTLIHLVGLLFCIATIALERPWRDSRELVEISITAGSAVLMLALAQLLIVPKMYSILAIPPAQEFEKTGASALPTAAEPISREVILVGGRVRLRMEDWPRVGPIGASHVIAFLFDYTCKTCRNMYRLLMESIDHYDGNLAVLMIVVPQDCKCNPLIRKIEAAQVHACQYARLAWAVWRTKPEMFATFSQWLNQGEAVPPIKNAEEEVRQILASSMDAALRDTRIQPNLYKASDVFTAAGAQTVPGILLNDVILGGDVPSARDLNHILGRDLKIARQQN